MEGGLVELEVAVSRGLGAAPFVPLVAPSVPLVAPFEVEQRGVEEVWVQQESQSWAAPFEVGPQAEHKLGEELPALLG